MFLRPDEFRRAERKRITLLGMSGVGKTTLAANLPRNDWFHFSADYRIGTRYLGEPILDDIKRRAMEVPFLRELLRSDSIYIASNITVDNLTPISTFLGKLGDPAEGGLSLGEFTRRQALHRAAEIATMRDVPDFIDKAWDIYGYRHFLNDTSGSVCEIDDPDTLAVLAEHTILVYIRPSLELEQMLIDRARRDPKPLYYREAFLAEKLPVFLAEKGLTSIEQADPDELVTWIFPHLFHARIPRYEAIAAEHGYTIDASAVQKIRSEADFEALIEAALAQR